MTANEFTCWKCGVALGDMPLPLGREARCKSCHANLHCCRMCIFYDRTVSKACREPIAEEVKDKTRANFCGYLQINPDAYNAKGDTKTQAASSELEALFNIESGTGNPNSSSPDESIQKLKDLFDLDK